MLGLGLFLLTERHIGDGALIPLRLFRDSVFSLTSVTAVIIGMGMFGGIAVLPQYLQIVQGASPTEAGLLTVPLVLGIMTASVISGQITSRTGRYKIFPVIGTALMVVGLLLLSRIGVDTSLWQVDVYMAVFGLGLGGCMQTLILAVQNAAGPRDMGVATASATFFRQMGGTLDTAIFLSILFSTVGDRIGQAFASVASTPEFRAALTDPTVRADPANRPVFDAMAAGGLGGNATGVLDDSSFLHQLEPRLARPFLVGFSDSISLVFLVGAAIMVFAFVLLLFLEEVPLRTQSGVDARAAEDRAAAVPAAAVPATVSEELGDPPTSGRHVHGIAERAHRTA